LDFDMQSIIRFFDSTAAILLLCAMIGIPAFMILCAIVLAFAAAAHC